MWRASYFLTSGVFRGNTGYDTKCPIKNCWGLPFLPLNEVSGRSVFSNSFNGPLTRVGIFTRLLDESKFDVDVSYRINTTRNPSVLLTLRAIFFLVTTGSFQSALDKI